MKSAQASVRGAKVRMRRAAEAVIVADEVADTIINTLGRDLVHEDGFDRLSVRGQFNMFASTIRERVLRRA